MFKKIIQRWNVFKADWAEYQRLRRIAGRAWKKLYSLRARITDVDNSDTTKAGAKSCIRTSVVCQNQSLFDERDALILVEDYCPNFKAFDVLGAVRPCKEKFCSCYAHNCEYAAAAAEYADALQKRREFWAASQRGNEK